MTSGGRVPLEVLRLIAHITAGLGDVSIALQRQAGAAIVSRYSPTMLNFTVPRTIPAVDLEDGPISVQAAVYEGERLTGELLAWVQDGRLIGMEQAWFTDETPKSWPTPDRVRLT